MVACAVAAVGFLLRFDWTLHYFYDPIPAWFGRTLWPLLGKSDLSPLRLINVAAVALVVARLVPRQAKFLRGRAAWPLLACGRHSLHIFCLGILLSVTGHYVLTELYGGGRPADCGGGGRGGHHGRRRRVHGLVPGRERGKMAEIVAASRRPGEGRLHDAG